MKSDFNINSEMTVELSEMIPGERGKVDQILAEGPVGQRLMDLGLLPGTPIRNLRESPLGDPTVYELRGYRLCLRAEDAARVLVRPEIRFEADAVSDDRTDDGSIRSASAREGKPGLRSIPLPKKANVNSA